MSTLSILFWLMDNKATILGIAAALYTLLTLIVKLCPTLDEGWLLDVIKFLAKITNRQTDDGAVRQTRKLAKSPVK